MSLRSAILEGPAWKSWLISAGLAAVPGAGPLLSGAYNAARIGNSFSNYVSRQNATNNPSYTGPNDLFGVGAPAAPGQPSTQPTYTSKSAPYSPASNAPYVPSVNSYYNNVLAPAAPQITSIPPMAQTWLNWVRSKNQL